MTSLQFHSQRDDIALLQQHGRCFDHAWQVVDGFEREIAGFFGSKWAVATDCCTHALELSLRALAVQERLTVPRHTYMSVPMMLDKIGVPYQLETQHWQGHYELVPGRVIDAATAWLPGSYQPGTLTCVSFQFKKHLPIGRGGMILLDDDVLYAKLQRMVRDGRDPRLTQFEDDVAELGYHYFMTPEDAARGLYLFDNLKHAPARVWSWQDYRDLAEMSYFRHRA